MRITVVADTSYRTNTGCLIEEKTYLDDPVITVARGKNHYHASMKNPKRQRTYPSDKLLNYFRYDPYFHYYSTRSFNDAYKGLKEIYENLHS